MFRRVVVIGLGLIGGSVAAAASRIDQAPVVIGVDTDTSAREIALARGYVRAAHDPGGALGQGVLDPGAADLVVIATPVNDVVEWLGRLHAAGFDGIVTDVASTKSEVVSAAAALRPRFTFIGGHPMAGSERSGIEAARADLFDGAYYVLTPTQETDTHAFRSLHEFVTALGARPISIPADKHDEAVALISHVPHVAAAALVALVADQPAGQDALRLAAGGFKDMTRIAAGSPDLWTGICLDNAERIASGLDRLTALLGEFAGALRSRETSRVRDLLDDAARIRRSLPARWAPSTSALFVLSIPMRDKPGVISEITTAVGRAGCNIEDIEIDHITEDSAMLRLVLTDEGDRDALLKDLESAGYAASLRRLEEE